MRTWVIVCNLSMSFRSLAHTRTQSHLLWWNICWFRRADADDDKVSSLHSGIWPICCFHFPVRIWQLLCGSYFHLCHFISFFSHSNFNIQYTGHCVIVTLHWTFDANLGLALKTPHEHCSFFSRSFALILLALSLLTCNIFIGLFVCFGFFVFFIVCFSFFYSLCIEWKTTIRQKQQFLNENPAIYENSTAKCSLAPVEMQTTSLSAAAFTASLSLAIISCAIKVATFEKKNNNPMPENRIVCDHETTFRTTFKNNCNEFK